MFIKYIIILVRYNLCFIFSSELQTPWVLQNGHTCKPMRRRRPAEIERRKLFPAGTFHLTVAKRSDVLDRASDESDRTCVASPSSSVIAPAPNTS
jgi:hypothetical protein